MSVVALCWTFFPELNVEEIGIIAFKITKHDESWFAAFARF
jgi:hypothetical protein